MLLRLGARNDHLARRQCGNHGIAGASALAVPRAANHPAARVAGQRGQIAHIGQLQAQSLQAGRYAVCRSRNGLAGVLDSLGTSLAGFGQYRTQFGGGVLVLIDDVLLHAVQLLGRIGAQTVKEADEFRFHQCLHVFRQGVPGIHGVGTGQSELLRSYRRIGRAHALLIRLLGFLFPVVVFLLRVHSGGFDGLDGIGDAVGDAVDVAAYLDDAGNLQVIALLHQPSQLGDVAGIGPVHVCQLLVVVAGQARGLLHTGCGRFKQRITDRLADVFRLVIGDGEQPGHGLLDLVGAALDRQTDIQHGLVKQALRIHLHQHCENRAQVIGAAADTLNGGIHQVRHRADLMRRVHPVLHEPRGHFFLIRHQPMRTGNKAFGGLSERTQ